MCSLEFWRHSVLTFNYCLRSFFNGRKSSIEKHCPNKSKLHLSLLNKRVFGYVFLNCVDTGSIVIIRQKQEGILTRSWSMRDRVICKNNKGTLKLVLMLMNFSVVFTFSPLENNL